MPHKISINDELSLVIGKIWGVVDDQSFGAYFDDMETLGPFAPEFNLLVVIEEDSELEVQTQAIRDFAQRKQTFADGALRVIVATRHIAYGLSRVYMSTTGAIGDQYRITNNMAEASLLLNISPDLLKAAIDNISKAPE